MTGMFQKQSRTEEGAQEGERKEREEGKPHLWSTDYMPNVVLAVFTDVLLCYDPDTAGSPFLQTGYTTSQGPKVNEKHIYTQLSPPLYPQHIE